MEYSFGAFLDEEMETLSTMFSCEDSDQFMLHFNVANILSNTGQIPSNFFSGEVNGEGLFLTNDTNFQESSNCSAEIGSALLLNQSGHEFYHANATNFLDQDVINSNTVDSYPIGCKNDNLIVPFFADHVMEEILQPEVPDIENRESREAMQLKRRYEASGAQTDLDKGFVANHQSSTDKFEDNSSESPRKKSRVSRSDVQKNKRTAQSKKNMKTVQISIDHVEEESNNNGGVNGQISTSSFSSEEDLNASQDLNEGSNSEPQNSKGKARASRGSATDPQSLYARKRRERINERLKILQTLVPNGTKVDISTMLEEAVQYVKFLQVQIKLLSSDEMWMYAPIAYNGMDIGLYNKISPNLWA